MAKSSKLSAITAFLMSLFVFISGCTSGGGVTTSTITTSESYFDGNSGSVNSSSSNSQGDSKTSDKAVTSSEKKALETAKKELNGYTFTIASGWMTDRDDVNESTPLYERLFWERAAEVEKEYGCTIKSIRFYARNNDLKTYIMAGKKVADLVESMPVWIPQNVSTEYLQPWENVKGINLSDTKKWLSYASSASTYKGKVYGVQFMKPAEARYCVMFNKTLLAKSGVNVKEIYNLVRNKKWTWEKLSEYAKKATKDTNSDGINDTWGIIGKYDYVGNAILSSYGGNLIDNKSGAYKFNLNSSSSINALNAYNTIVNTDKTLWVADQLNSETAYKNINEQTYVQKFNSGSAAFLIWESWVLNQYTRANANFEYGILPLPLGGSQTKYVSPAENMRVFCLTSTNKDLDKASVVINALAENFGDYKGDDWYEDVQTDYFKNDAADNLDMYKTILNSSMVDYGQSIEGLQAAFYHDVILNSIYWKKATPSAAVDSIKETYKDSINTVFN